MRSDEEAWLSRPVDQNDHIRGAANAPVPDTVFGIFRM